MIKLNNVNKYFNKKKSNEIHIINDTTLEFPNKGLITLLGYSGSGKTTLLNVVSGLDYIDNGEIIFNNYQLSNNKNNKWDELRKNDIGYIFQNYYLLENISVFENLKMVLNMIGLFDETQINNRVDYILAAVKLEKFKYRMAQDLSGGQKQRVALARALIKNPNVIIADEPTGNLDTNNGIEIMKIIKEISKEKLVILVTHNEALARNYSDRIIELKDGKVIDDHINTSDANNLNYIDNNIYLQDLQVTKNNNITIYSDTSISDLNLTLVKKGNSIYLVSDENFKLNTLNDKSNVKLIDSKKETYNNTFLDDTSFKLEEMTINSDTLETHKYFSYKYLISNELRNKNEVSKLFKDKAQNFIMIIIGIFLAIGLIMMVSTFVPNNSKIKISDKIYSDMTSSRTFEKYKDDEDITYFGFNNQNYSGNDYPSVSLELYSGKSIVLTYLPQKEIDKKAIDPFDVYIDESLLSRGSKYKRDLNALGFFNKEDFVNQKIKLKFDYTEVFEFNIIGTVNTKQEAVYLTKEALTYIDANMVIRGMESNIIIPTSVEEPAGFENYDSAISGNFTDVVVSKSVPESEFQGLADRFKFRVVGTHTDPAVNKVYINDNDVYEHIFYRNNETSRLNSHFFVYTYSNEDLRIKYSLFNTNKMYKDMVFKAKLEKLVQSIVFVAGAILMSFLSLYYLVRSSLINKVKEVSILRSLGASKNDIKKMFVVKNTMLLLKNILISLVLGIVISSVLLPMFNGDDFEPFNFIVILVVLILMYLMNLLISLLPINRLLRKTPAQLLTQYDI